MDRHNFDLETLTERNLMLVLGPLGEEKYKILQINYISRMLTTLSLFSKLFLTTIYQECAPMVTLFLIILRFLHMNLSQSFCQYVSHAYCPS